MAAINLVFPHQLFEKNPLLENGLPVYLVEEWLFFNQYSFHKQKIAFHRASMQFYADFLRQKGISVTYIEAHQTVSDIRLLIKELAEKQIKVLHFIDPTDNWLEKRIVQSAHSLGMETHSCESPLFLNNQNDLHTFFKPEKKKFFQTTFYKQQRIKRNILLDDAGKPTGGKWTFDTENRKKYPAKKQAPAVSYPELTPFYTEAIAYVEKYFPDNFGELSSHPLYPHTFEAARLWFSQFLNFRFAEFGPYEDAMLDQPGILNHSVLSPLLNVGLLRPYIIVESALNYADEHEVPLNSLEGFIRQIIGWREFIRGIYQCKGSEERTRNYWNFNRKIPNSFYTGNTGIPPVDKTIRKVLQTGYCHHIERLMVLGNFMLLCEFDPDEVYRWFMELFIDAYDWVMVPNVYGMSQFADGGMFATKPYISGSNYLMKMSNYPKGEWQELWNALFWRFMDVHRAFFVTNPRLGMLVRSFDKMAEEKKQDLRKRAEMYLQRLV